MLRFCEAGVLPPIWKLKVSAAGLTFSKGAELTVKVTETVTGLLPALEELTVIVPLYVFAASPVGFTETLKLWGVVPLPGLTDSQLPPDADAVKLSAEPVLPTLTFWDGGFEPPVVKENDSADGLTVRFGAAVTVSVTGTDNGLFEAPPDVIVMVPL